MHSDGTSSTIQITTAVYVVDDLKVSVLLKINIMIKERVRIDLEINSLIIQDMQTSIIYFKLFYTSFHVTVQSLMYEILITWKTYYAEKAVTKVSVFTALIFTAFTSAAAAINALSLISSSSTVKLKTDSSV